MQPLSQQTSKMPAISSNSSPRYVPLLRLLLLLLAAKLTESIQDYNEQDQLGYKCSASAPISAASCPAQLVFLARKGRSPQEISDQFQQPVLQVMSANSITTPTSAAFAADRLLLIPARCSCNSTTNRSSASVPYTVRFSDTFFSIATDTFHFLTTFTAIGASNAGVIPTKMEVGSSITVPIRCACSDRRDRLLVTYPLSSIDRSVSDLIDELAVEQSELLAENRLLPADALQPGTTVLIPVRRSAASPVLNLPPVPAESPAPVANPVDPDDDDRQQWKFYLGISSAAGGIVLLIALTVVLVIFHRKRRQTSAAAMAAMASASESVLPSQDQKLASPFFSPKSKGSSIRSNAAKISMPDVLEAVKPTWYSIQEIRDATGDFDPAFAIRGSSSLYAAVLRGRKVAIKKAEDGTDSARVLSRVHHANLIALVGACHDESTNQTFLAYEFAENGSLRDCLSGAAAARAPPSRSDDDTTAATAARTPPTRSLLVDETAAAALSQRSLLENTAPDQRSSSSLPKSIDHHPNKAMILAWETRLQIALDVARGLEYLHNYARPGFVHKNIRSSNVLLDSSFHAKLSSFHKAKESSTFDNASVDTTTTIFADADRHSLGYKAPEYLLHGIVSTKTDVYAFGVVLLELLTGLDPVIEASKLPSRSSQRIARKNEDFVALADAIVPALDREPDSLLEWIDPGLIEAEKRDFTVEDAATLAFLARTCLERDPRKRPTMRDVAWALSQMRGGSGLT